MDNRLIFILGGARSGKSRFAERLTQQYSDRVLFVATAEPLDEEMDLRIKEHKRNRPVTWRTLEAPIGVGRATKEQIGGAEVVIVDCLTLLISNLLTRQGGESDDYADSEQRMLNELEELIQCIEETRATFIIVSNEVGTGLVPGSKVERIYRDLLGRSNQLLAEHMTVFPLTPGLTFHHPGHMI